jgi:hypothetical protein
MVILLYTVVMKNMHELMHVTYLEERLTTRHGCTRL